MNSDIKQEKERVNQYVRDEKVSDTSVLVQVQIVRFYLQQKWSLK